ncbi:MAG: aldehyde dehydrogenase family protein [Methylococcaceae bacterium]|jgi:acyl-CoA reductase-like NAD-dependent aldehyde dehydrogenase
MSQPIIRVISPIDYKMLGDFVPTSASAIRQQMALAQGAAIQWAKLPVAQRVKVLSPLKALLLAKLDAICGVITLTTGKVRTEALLGEVYPILDLLRYYENNAAHILQAKAIATSPFIFPGATADITRKPYGVVAVISPWNYPFQLTIAPLLSALFAGNAVIFKASELCLPIGQLILNLLAKLDLPKGLVQWAVGDGQVGEYLIDAGPDLVFFTGGLTAGRAVMQRAARHPIPVMLELGGKDPMLVFADAQLKRACDGALYGAFCNSGQACISVERLYVEQSCYSQFVQMLVEGVEDISLGHGLLGDLGTVSSERQFEIVQAHYQDAIAQGASASAPLRRLVNYVKPIVLWNVHHGMRVMREETFGPLLPVMAFTDEAEAINLANDSEYGLNASIWSLDLTKAQRVARQLQVGNWAVNDVLKNAGHSGLPFGGVKRSGFGRYHGAEGLRNFTYPVSGLVSHSRFSKEPNWFPYSQQRYEDFKGYLDFIYGEGPILRRVKRNWQALQAFRGYSAFNFAQRLQNLKAKLPWRQD